LAPLKIGDNQLTVSLTRPGGSSEDVSLVLPVQYRVRGDVSALAQDPPKLRVVVEAVPGTTIVIDGKPASLGGDGRAQVDIDVSKDLTGSASKVQRLERRYPYTITPPGSDPQPGEVTLQLGIVPLQVDAPGERIVVETPTFMLAGRTQKGGTVSVAGRPITTDADGNFAQLMNVSAVGKTTISVRASAPDQAPRLFLIEVQRVASLQEEARSLAGRATRAYSAVIAEPDAKRGWSVALQGEVVEARVQDHTTAVVLDVTRGCAKRPCLSRVLHGAALTLKAGQVVTAYGTVLGSVDGPRPGTRIPEIRADFVLMGSGP
jgi:hypothetical protein